MDIMKPVYNIGLPRTGTRSLALFFKHFGYNINHPNIFKNYNVNYYHILENLNEFEKDNNYYSDTPIWHYKFWDILKLHDKKVICSIRNKDSWIRSVQNFSYFKNGNFNFNDLVWYKDFFLDISYEKLSKVYDNYIELTKQFKDILYINVIEEDNKKNSYNLINFLNLNQKTQIMKLSIITPSIRPHNLPIIHQYIVDGCEIISGGIEWIIICDSEEIDDRILQYKSPKIDIKITNHIRKEGDPYAAFVRNDGLKLVTGDYIYYLDDDNIIHKKFYENLVNYVEYDKILIFNQFDRTLKRARHKAVFSLDMINPEGGRIDTAQFIIPKLYKHFKWIDGGPNDETPYLLNIINEIGADKIKWINKLCTYRNFLRRDTIN